MFFFELQYFYWWHILRYPLYKICDPWTTKILNFWNNEKNIYNLNKKLIFFYSYLCFIITYWHQSLKEQKIRYENKGTKKKQTNVHLFRFFLSIFSIFLLLPYIFSFFSRNSLSQESKSHGKKCLNTLWCHQNRKQQRKRVFSIKMLSHLRIVFCHGKATSIILKFFSKKLNIFLSTKFFTKRLWIWQISTISKNKKP